ncbi:MAG: DUF5011 domain-containing protein, partial [Planctomycetes bacterium]|nr:DUF5011 domain-containing protein [Planctomycetota bacterium]
MMNTKRHTLVVLVTVGVLLPARSNADDACPEETLWEPYTERCAEVRDRQDEFWNLAIGGTAKTAEAAARNPFQTSERQGDVQSKPDEDFPVPGRMSVGINYAPGYLRAVESGRLHTKMFVHPDGLGESSSLPLFYTPATSRIQGGLEFVGVYSSDGSGAADGLGRVALFAWTCVPDYPCPNGSPSPRWQWFIRQSDLPCHITHDVDQGGHAQKMMYYANHTDKLADDAPPLWRSALYLWNYCDDAWDMAWEHEYQQEKIDCSEGNRCAFWGPAIETFTATVHPQIAEIGFEDSLLYHDGEWSEFRPPETRFWDFDANDPLSLWQLFHRDPNRGWGAGSFFEENNAPAIDKQTIPIETPEDTPISIEEEMLEISDPDVDPRFHVAYALTVYAGENYTHDGRTVTPDPDFAGPLVVPVSANDGAADSPIFDLEVSVTAVNDPPQIAGQSKVEVLERTPITLGLEHVAASDIDTDPDSLLLLVSDGTGYTRSDNTITPDSGVTGELFVTVRVSDGELESEPFALLVNVLPDEEPPILTLTGDALVELTVGTPFTDPGATAVDNLDGDLSDQIITEGTVNTSLAGTYAIIYRVSDLAGNVASAERRVVVTEPPPPPDTTPPEITLVGDNPLNIETGSPYTEYGATATDDVDGDLTESVEIDASQVDIQVAGRYEVFYDVSDTAGNAAETAVRIVIVENPATPPPPPPSSSGGGSMTTSFLLLI